MRRTGDYSNYPLPEALTRRVVSYLNIYRLIISLGLLYALFAGLVTVPNTLNNDSIAGTVLITYLVMAIVLATESRKKTTQPFFLAQISLFTDILFLSMLLFLFGGLESGVALLLIFASASAAILLPLRIALFFTSLVVLVFIGEALVEMLFRGGTQKALIRAGLYGTTTFVISILLNLLSHWIKDYRLIAERQAEELTRMEQINELVIRRMRSGVIAVDAECRIQLMNESAFFLLGSPKREQKMLAKVAPQLDAALSMWRDNPNVEIAPITLKTSQARILPKFVSLPGTQSIRFLIFLEDNDVVSQRAMEMSANLLANLSGSIAHEIRNPLAAVSHAAQLLDESEDIAEADLRLVDIIHTQSVRMNGIVENILQLSRHEKSRPDIFDLIPFLEKLAVETKSSLPGIRLTLHIDPDEGEKLVLFDRSQLHQALWKLLENALRHAHLDAAIPQVELSMEHLSATGYCVITVEDNGPGIPESNMARIFDPFFTTHKQGSGLGLYIARQLCDVNQSELTVDSILGSRSRFHIRLALARTERDNLSVQ
jgi:two-component system sensor histidine kinase PilS (NtrC family)